MLLKKRRGMPAQMCCAHFQQGKVVQEKSVVQTSVDSLILGRKFVFRAFSCSVCAVAARRRGCSFCKRSLPFGRHSDKLLTDISCLLQTTNKNFIRCLQKHLILNQESNPADYISSTRHSPLRVARPKHLKFWVSKYCVKCDKYSLF